MPGDTPNPFPLKFTAEQVCTFSHKVVSFIPVPDSPEVTSISIGHSHSNASLRFAAPAVEDVDRVRLYNVADLIQVKWESRHEEVIVTRHEEEGYFNLDYTATGPNDNNSSYYTRLVQIMPELDPAVAVHWLLINAINEDIRDTQKRKRRKVLAWHAIRIARSPEEAMSRIEPAVRIALETLPDAVRNQGLDAHNDRHWKQKSA